MATASSMIFRALRLIGEKAPGGSLSATEQSVYLDDLNSMLDSWQIERLMCYHVSQESFALTASTASYTIGTNGTFATARPTRIVDPCFVRDASNVDTPLKLIPVDSYGSIPVKSGSNSYPQYLYYDHGFSSTSTATISLYPPPQAGLTLFINSVKQLQSFGSISTVMVLPPGYQRAIEFNLAIELSGGLTSVSPEVAKVARESKAALKTMNLPDTMMSVDLGIAYARRSSILNGP